MSAYYNEFDPFAAAWLRELIKKDLIAPGDVDERSITEVKADDLKKYTQCHFFAGIGGWSYALRLAMWPDDRPVWTGSCPCQPFSLAGKGGGQSDERHLWPHWFRLIAECRPSTIFGEQVAAAIGQGWLDDVAHDLETKNYACAAAVLPACSAGAFHRRDRLWFVANCANGLYESERARGDVWRYEESVSADPSAVANAEGHRRIEGERQQSRKQGRRDALFLSPCGGDVANSIGHRRKSGRHHYRGDDGPIIAPASEQQCIVANTLSERRCSRQSNGQDATDAYPPSETCGIEWVECPDGKRRAIKPGVRLLANGVPSRVGKLRAYGNAIDPRIASEFITAFMDVV